ncbi:MAG: helix-turn-helix transcriptional regulator, partial [Ruminococcus sp.]|nr:helix-turn-helix transcriptional regulator [Ruminococcus sp.]
MIGKKLKELRKQKGLTIAEAAEIFNVSTRTYTYYEAEGREPN